MPGIEHNEEGAALAHPPQTGDTVEQADPVAFTRGMALVRRRRKYFFGVVIGYMPLMWLAHKLSPSFQSMAITFSVWVAVLFLTALYSALARCPRCGNYFHMNGMSLLYLRRCLHCQLPVNAKNEHGGA